MILFSGKYTYYHFYRIEVESKDSMAFLTRQIGKDTSDPGFSVSSTHLYCTLSEKAPTIFHINYTFKSWDSSYNQLYKIIFYYTCTTKYYLRFFQPMVPFNSDSHQISTKHQKEVPDLSDI